MKTTGADRGITVRNLQRAIAVSEKNLTAFAGLALAACLKARAPQAKRREFPKEIAVLLISDRRIAKLHLQFMNEPGPTDVITFEHGEIFISMDTARRHARRFATSVGHETRLYIVHGLLHLRGFDDRTPGAARRMQALQEKILRQVSASQGRTGV